MNNQYKRTKTTVSLINYHFVFCPRYRRKIFLIPGVEDRFKVLVRMICMDRGWDIIALECDKDHCHLFVSAMPTDSPHDIIKAVKGATSHALRDEFPQLCGMSSLWTRSYFCSTAGAVSSETIERYVKSQKQRG